MSLDSVPELFSDDWEVPAYSTDIFFSRKNKFCIVIPVINEGERIRNQIGEMNRLEYTGKCDVIIVDGGSTDGSLDRNFLKGNNIRGIIVKIGQGKLSAQLRCAYSFALREGYSGIITIDGNGKDSVNSLDQFIRALNEGIDYAQASRFLNGGEAVNTPRLRYWAIRLIHAPLLSLAARRWLTDTTQGYRAYSARYLLDARVRPFRRVFDKYELLAYLTVRAGQLGFRIIEIPTVRKYPRGEPIPTKIGGYRAYLDLLLVLGRTVFGMYNPEKS